MMKNEGKGNKKRVEVEERVMGREEEGLSGGEKGMTWSEGRTEGNGGKENV